MIMLRNLRSGFYLHVKAQEQSSGDPVYQKDSTSDGSKWQVAHGPDGSTMLLKNVRSGFFLTATERSKATCCDKVFHIDSGPQNVGDMWIRESPSAPGKTQPQTQSQQKKLTSATRREKSWDNATGPYAPSLHNTTGPHAPSLDDGDDECSEPCSAEWVPCPYCPEETASQVCADHGAECAGEPATCGQTCNVFSYQCHWEAQCCGIGKYCGDPGLCCQASDECVDPPASNSDKVEQSPNGWPPKWWGGKKCCMKEVEMRDSRKCLASIQMDMSGGDAWWSFTGKVDCACTLVGCECTATRVGWHGRLINLWCDGRVVFPPGDESVAPPVQVKCEARCCSNPTDDNMWCEVFDCV